MLDLALLDLIIRDRARTASERKDVDHRHVTDIDALVHTVAQDRIGEVATVVATQMDVDIVDEIMEVTADVAAGRCHDLLLTLALYRLVRTMRRQGRRRGTSADVLRPEREHHVTRAGQECQKTPRRVTLVSCLSIIVTYM